MVENESIPPESQTPEPQPLESQIEADEQSDAVEWRKYFIDPDTAEASRRSLPMLVASRQCYMCQQGLPEDVIIDSDPQDFMDQIYAHCSQQDDYLLSDTPMKEAIFRVLLAGGNEPMNAEAIGASLSEKWATTPFPRDTSPRVIQRLLDNSAYYCIAPMPEPEAQEGE